MKETQEEIQFEFGVACSLVLFGFDGKQLNILTVKRDSEPFKDAWILPSAYLTTKQTTEDLVSKIMKQYTQADYAYIEQLKAFVKVYRNPLGRVINIAYYALVNMNDVEPVSDKNELQWMKYSSTLDLAFDHNDIIEYAKERLKRRVKRRPIGFYLLPKEFTIKDLQRLYESALGRKMDKRNFRKKIFNSALIVETGNEDSTLRKPAKLYSFDEDAYEKLTLKGYDFLF